MMNAQNASLRPIPRLDGLAERTARSLALEHVRHKRVLGSVHDERAERVVASNPKKAQKSASTVAWCGEPVCKVDGDGGGCDRDTDHFPVCPGNLVHQVVDGL